MALLGGQANDLREAVQNLEPTHSLKVSELDSYFVEREQTPICEMELALEDASIQKFLFTGNRGNGKGTELSKLVKYLDSEFFIVRYELKNVLDLFDLSYLDVLVSIAIQIAKKVEEEVVDLEGTTERALETLWSFGREAEKQVEQSKSQGGEAGIGTGGVFGSLLNVSAKIKSESGTRQILREKVEYRISDLLEGIDILARDVEKKTNKRLLCIIEDLDKIDPEVAEDIFYKRGQSISAPELSIIYTFPVTLHHSNDFTQVSNFFDGTYKLPNFKVDKPQIMADILKRRLRENLIASEAVEMLVEYSGGVPRHLIRLARSSCLKARVDAKVRIEQEHVEDAITKERNDFDRMLSKAQLELLRGVSETQRIDQTKEYRELLHNLSVLEYENGHLWHQVNPVVRDLLK